MLGVGEGCLDGASGLVMFLLMTMVTVVQLMDKTCTSPTPTLEQHLMWDDIAILARYLLMLSFNNSLDGVCSAMPTLIFSPCFSLLVVYEC